MKAKANKDWNLIRLSILLVIILVIASAMKPQAFLSKNNFVSMMKQLVEYGVMALGVSVAMISGGIDLSVVYIANLSGIVAGLIMQSNDSAGMIFVAIVASLIVGVACGSLNGFLVSRLNIPPMLATLGTMQLFMGISIILTQGGAVSGMPELYTKIGNYQLFGWLPLSFVIYVILTLLVAFVFNRTKFGLRVYLIGTNIKASKFAAIETEKILSKTYILSGLLASIAGLLSLSRINSARADFGSSYTMQTILISVMGGVSPNGGSGNIAGVFIATIIVQLISSFLNMFPQISNFYRDLIWGVILIAVLIVNYTMNKRSQQKLAESLQDGGEENEPE